MEMKNWFAYLFSLFSFSSSLPSHLPSLSFLPPHCPCPTTMEFNNLLGTELALLVCVASVFDVFKALGNFDVS
jgi:hypothetical protein